MTIKKFQVPIVPPPQLHLVIFLIFIFLRGFSSFSKKRLCEFQNVPN